MTPIDEAGLRALCEEFRNTHPARTASLRDELKKALRSRPRASSAAIATAWLALGYDGPGAIDKSFPAEHLPALLDRLKADKTRETKLLLALIPKGKNEKRLAQLLRRRAQVADAWSDNPKRVRALLDDEALLKVARTQTEGEHHEPLMNLLLADGSPASVKCLEPAIERALSTRQTRLLETALRRFAAKTPSIEALKARVAKWKRDDVAASPAHRWAQARGIQVPAKFRLELRLATREQYQWLSSQVPQVQAYLIVDSANGNFWHQAHVIRAELDSNTVMGETHHFTRPQNYAVADFPFAEPRCEFAGEPERLPEVLERIARESNVSWNPDSVTIDTRLGLAAKQQLLEWFRPRAPSQV